MTPPEFIDSLRPLEEAPESPVSVWTARFRVPPPPARKYPIPTVEWSNVSGKGWSNDEAQASCIGEAIERRSGMHRGDEPFRAARFAELAPDAVSPAVLQQLSETQFQQRSTWNRVFGAAQYIPHRWREDDLLEWVECRSLTNGGSVWAPAGACYLRHAPEEPRLLFAGQSAGYAAASTRDEAAARAFLETVERDALALWWYNRCPRPTFFFGAGVSERIGRAAAYLAAHGRTLHLLDLTTDFGIPVAAAVSATIAGDAILFGFAADFSRRRAAERASAELIQILGPPRLWTRDAMLEGYREMRADRKAWITAATVENQPYIIPNDSAPATPAQPVGHATALEESIDRARRAGLDFLICDVTREDPGVPVVRAIVSGMRSSWAHLGPGRLYETPVQLGWLDRPNTEAEMNPFPFFL